MTLAMLGRELAKGDRVFWIEVADRNNGAGLCWDRTNDCHDYTDYWKRYGFEWGPTHSDAEFAAKLQAFLRRMEADGWAETERSLTRRVFWHTGKKPGKFWIICLGADEYEVHFGRIPKHLHQWGTHSGRRVKRTFPTREKAASAYAKLIAEKLSKGYVEVRSRVRLDTGLRTREILALAQAAQTSAEMHGSLLDPARLAVLADALEEAGCTDAGLLEHLRGPGPHVRGCWAVDLLLGKS
jgi:predicted DNA-binding WGR domain protein